MAALVAPVALTPVVVSAQTSPIKSGLSCGTEFETGRIEGGGECTAPGGAGGATNRIEDIVKLIINIFSWIVGIIAVIMIIVGGLKYITSGGDSGNVGSAKNTILYAVVGLIVVALSQFIVRFVLEKVNI